MVTFEIDSLIGEKKKLLYETILECDNTADKCRALGLKRQEKAFRHASKQLTTKANFSHYNALKNLRFFPPTAEEVLDGKDFLNGELEIWDSVRHKFLECNPDIITGEAPVHQVIDGGSLGAGKSVSMFLNCLMSLLTVCYFRDFHELFSLQKSTQIVFSLIGDGMFETRASLYDPCRENFLSMPFVKKYLKWDTRNESILRLSNGCVLMPKVAGSRSGRKAVANFFVGLDESNHQPVIERSKRSDAEEGTYDQAMLNYDTMYNRCVSRFGGDFFTFYKVYIGGSAKYEGDMMDRLETKWREKNIPNTKIFNLAQWEAQPKHKFSKETFVFCCGDSVYNPHIVEQGKIGIKDNMKILNPPVDYLVAAQLNPAKFQRDQGGVRSNAISPFISNVEAVNAAFKPELTSIATIDNLILKKHMVTDNYFEIFKKNLPPIEERQKPHFVGVDLSKNNCRTGFTLLGISDVIEKDSSILPKYTARLCGSIDPINNSEIRPALIRNLIKALRDDFGFNIAGVAYDSYGSTESIQILTDWGFNCKEISTVKTDTPYNDLRNAIYNYQIEIPENEILKKELKTLEEIVTGHRTIIEKGNGSTKDIADTLASTVHFSLLSTQWADMRLNYQRGYSVLSDETKEKLEKLNLQSLTKSTVTVLMDEDRPLRPWEKDDDW